MLVFPGLIYKFDVILIEIPMGTFTSSQADSKFKHRREGKKILNHDIVKIIRQWTSIVIMCKIDYKAIIIKKI